MKKQFYSKLLFLFALLLTVSTSAWADEVTLLTEDFSAITTGNSTSTGGSNSQWNGNDNFTSVTKAYQAGGAVKIGAGSSTGSITSKSLTVEAGTLSVAFDVKGWSSVEGDIKVTVGTESKTITYTSTLNGTFESKSAEFNIAEQGSISVTLATTAKRAFLDNIVIKNITSGGGGGSETQTCAAPTFSLAAGSYIGAQSVALSTATEGATIHYTLDESDPDVNSSVYESAIAVNENTTIKAIAVKDGMENSAIASATYTIVNLGHAGTVEDPYTVADARAAIDANVGLTNVYATGIVSEIVTEYSAQYKNITFDISVDGTSTSEQLRAYRCVSGDAEVSDIKKGDEVVIYGNLIKYGSTYEFTQGNQLVSLKRVKTFTAVTDNGGTLLVKVDNAAAEVLENGDTLPINYNSTVEVEAVPATDDYVFSVWTPTGIEIENTAENPLTFTMPSADVQLSASFTEKNIEYGIEISSPITGGSVAVADNLTTATAGTEITLIATPAENYVFDSWTVLDGSANEVTVTNNTFTMPASNVLIGATFLPIYTITFIANGTQVDSQVAVEGTAIDFPEVDAIGGYSVVGWRTAEYDGTSDEALDGTITSGTITASATYYAVFAKYAAKTGDVEDKLDYTLIDVTGTGYTDWEGKSDESGAVYAGNSAGGNNSIQLRSSNSTSGIVSTTSGGTLKKVAVKWNSHTSSDRTLDVYGYTSAYTSPSELYGSSTLGTKIGSIVYGTSTELEVSDAYQYVGLRSYSGAMYLDEITITWVASASSYSSYCTSIPVPSSVTITAAANATWVAPANVKVSENVKVYTVEYIADKSKVYKHEVTDNVVPANAAVLLTAEGEATAEVAVTDEAATDYNKLVNHLQPSNGTKKGGTNIFCLSVGEEGLGFYPVSDKICVPAGKAYLDISLVENPSSVDGAPSYLWFNGDTTGIDSLTPDTAAGNESGEIYSLTGQRVGKNYRGIVIMNGRKVLKK